MVDTCQDNHVGCSWPACTLSLREDRKVKLSEIMK